MSNILEIKNLNFKYNKTTIFKDFNLSIEEGKFVSIAGNNTSGKTTLIKLICGILPSKESITVGYSYVDDKRIKDHTKDFGVVFGNKLERFIFEDVYKEMAFPLENLNIEVKEIEKRILEISSLFKINKLLDKKIKDLNMSEKQTLLIAIALLHNPKILLLDNAFSMMNKTQKKEIIKSLKSYQQENNLTIIQTTTNLEDTVYCDYLYIMNEGDILIEGEPLTVFKEDTLLNHLGLSLPFMVDLSLKLKFYEVLDDIELDIDRMVNTLWK